MMYVIHKKTRMPADKSYSGSTWDIAGIRHLYKELYEDRTEAEELAGILALHNLVGFKVAKKA